MTERHSGVTKRPLENLTEGGLVVWGTQVAAAAEQEGRWLSSPGGENRVRRGAEKAMLPASLLIIWGLDLKSVSWEL